MKKALSLLLVLIILAMNSLALADVEFDPSQFTDDELKEILEIIDEYLAGEHEQPNRTPDPDAITPEGTVLYDEFGVRVEYRGLKRKWGDTTFICLIVDNQSKRDVSCWIDGVTVNRYVSKIADAKGIKIPADSIFVSFSNSKFALWDSYLSPNGITKIESLGFTLHINNIPIEVSIKADFPIR